MYYLRAVVHAGEEEKARGLVSSLPHLVYDGKEYERIVKAGEWLVVELGDGREPPLTPLAGGGEDPQWAARHGLLEAAKRADTDELAKYHVLRLCVSRDPATMNCYTAYRAEQAVATDALVCAMLKADSALAATYRDWRDSAAVAALRKSIASLDVPSFSSGCAKAEVKTSILMNMLKKDKPISWCTTPAEMTIILRNVGKVCVLHAMKRAAHNKEVIRDVQSFVLFVGEHIEVTESSPFIGCPADAPGVQSWKEVTAFADAHNACVALLTADPTATRVSEVYKISGKDAVFSRVPARHTESGAKKTTVKILTNLATSDLGIRTIAAHPSLGVDMEKVATWAVGDAPVTRPRSDTSYDPGSSEYTQKEYTYPFTTNKNDVITFKLGSMTGTAERVIDGQHHDYTEGEYQLHLFVNPLIAGVGQAMQYTACDTFTMNVVHSNKEPQTFKLKEIVKREGDYVTYMLKCNSKYLRIDIDANDLVKSLRIYTRPKTHARKKAKTA